MKPGSGTWRAYFAGLIDGEGYIGIVPVGTGGGKGRKTLTILLAISMTTPAPLLLLKKYYGGSLISYKRKETHKEIYAWKVYAKKAEKVLRDVYPFLIIKTSQARLCLDVRDHMRNNGILTRGLGHNRNPKKDKSIIDFRERARTKIKQLNKRGG